MFINMVTMLCVNIGAIIEVFKRITKVVIIQICFVGRVKEFLESKTQNRTE